MKTLPLVLALLLCSSSAKPQTELRGHAVLRGASVLGAACNPLLTVCQAPQVTITAANIVSGDTVTLIPAFGANSAIQPVAIAVEYSAGSNGFSADYLPVITWAGSTTDACSFSAVETSHTTSQFIVNPCYGARFGDYTPLPSAVNNQGLIMFNENGPASGGNGFLTVTVMYTVVKII
jgi:hypothetical protein